MSITVFDFNSNQVRIVLIDNEPWFIAKDICDVLEIEVNDGIRRLKEYEKTKTDSIRANGISTGMVAISESGLYRMVLTSRKPQSEPFQDWVCQEVLPSIRKTGKYESKPSVPQTYAEALLEAGRLALENEKLEAEKKLLEGLNQDLEQENEVLSEAVDELFNYSSIIRVAKFNNVSETLFKWRILKYRSKQMGIEIKKVPCPRFEHKNLYSHDVWRVAYPNISLPDTTTLRLPESLD